MYWYGQVRHSSRLEILVASVSEGSLCRDVETVRTLEQDGQTRCVSYCVRSCGQACC